MAKINWKRKFEKLQATCLDLDEKSKGIQANYDANLDELNRTNMHVKTLERIETKLRENILFLERDLRASRQTIGVMNRHIDDLERNDHTNTVSFEKS